MEQFIKINDIKINYEIHNELRSECLFFIHGNSSDLKSFSNLFNHPALKNYKLIALDLPGHGRSDRLTVYTLNKMTDIIASFCKQLGLSDVHLVGHSFGGHLGIRTLHKHLFKSIYLCSTPPLIPEYFRYAFNPHENAGALFSETASEEKLAKLMVEFGHKGDDLKYNIKSYYNTDPRFRIDLSNECLRPDFENEFAVLEASNTFAHFLICKNDNLVNNNYILDFCANNEMISVSTIFAGHCPVNEKTNEFVSDLILFIEKMRFKARH